MSEEDAQADPDFSFGDYVGFSLIELTDERLRHILDAKQVQENTHQIEQTARDHPVALLVAAKNSVNEADKLASGLSQQVKDNGNVFVLDMDETIIDQLKGTQTQIGKDHGESLANWLMRHQQEGMLLFIGSKNSLVSQLSTALQGFFDRSFDDTTHITRELSANIGAFESDILAARRQEREV